MTPQELRSSILQLAIQGRLVEQRPEEGTAEELYRQIQTEKQALIIAGKIKKEKPLPEIAEDEVPFDIPESWKWVRLQDVVYPVGNKNNQILAKEVKVEGLYPAVSQGSAIFEGYSDNKEKVINDLPLVMFGDHTRNVKYIDFPFVICADGTKFMKAICVYPKYIYYWMSIVAEKLHNRGYARHFLLLTKKNIPLPPLAEQKSIVAKMEELLPLVDRYEQARQRLEVLNSRFPVDMQKSVLQLAIQGRLVPQRPEEGTGEDLFRQIQSEKQALIKAGKIKKEKPLPEITEDEIPFDIPESWKWVRLASLCKSIADGDHQPPPQVPNGVPFLVISNLSSGTIDFSSTRFVHIEYFKSLSLERRARRGDILFTVTGSYGIPVKVNCNIEFCFQRHMSLLRLMLDWDYLFYALKSPLVKGQCDAVATGTAQKTVGLNSLRNLIIPLPPLAEQKRIVARLEELLPLCEMLR